MIDMTREGKCLEAGDPGTLARFTATALAQGWETIGEPFDSVIEPGQFLQPATAESGESEPLSCLAETPRGGISRMGRTQRVGKTPGRYRVQPGLEPGEDSELNQIPILKLAALAKLTRRQTDVLRHIADTAGRGEYRDGAGDIAAALKISRSTATAHIRRLEAARVLRHTGTDTTDGAGSGRHVYRVNWPLIEAATGEAAGIDTRSASPDTSGSGGRDQGAAS